MSRNGEPDSRRPYDSCCAAKVKGSRDFPSYGRCFDNCERGVYNQSQEAAESPMPGEGEQMRQGLVQNTGMTKISSYRSSSDASVHSRSE